MRAMPSDTPETPPASPWSARLQRLMELNPLRAMWNAVQLWLDADGLRMSAAMSFYGILSLAPLLLLLAFHMARSGFSSIRRCRRADQGEAGGVSGVSE